MMTPEILLTVRAVERANNIQYLLTFMSSVDCSRFEVALHEAMAKAQIDVPVPASERKP